MTVALVTGALGLVGAEVVRGLLDEGFDVVGVDNDMRARFFGAEGSGAWMRPHLEALPGYRHRELDIRDADDVTRVVADLGTSLGAVVHAAAQPSHDWAARDPRTDFAVNADGTLNLLEAVRCHAPDAGFVFVSTNKVYGDAPNHLPLVEDGTRWRVHPGHPFAERGIDESLSIDQCLHSLFGASKVAADILVQEYGRYYGLNTGVFRAGCLTGPGHSGTQLHGFLAYLVKCALTGTPYTVFGYQGKQVRDNLHARDLADAFRQFLRAPRPGAVYNMGGGPRRAISVLEAIAWCETHFGLRVPWRYDDRPRTGDHMWWVTDTGRFRRDYPAWNDTWDLPAIMADLHEGIQARLRE